jgi:hypothetical protein
MEPKKYTYSGVNEWLESMSYYNPEFITRNHEVRYLMDVLGYNTADIKANERLLAEERGRVVEEESSLDKLLSYTHL